MSTEVSLVHVWVAQLNIAAVGAEDGMALAELLRGEGKQSNYKTYRLWQIHPDFVRGQQ